MDLSTLDLTPSPPSPTPVYSCLFSISTHTLTQTNQLYRMLRVRFVLNSKNLEELTNSIGDGSFRDIILFKASSDETPMTCYTHGNIIKRHIPEDSRPPGKVRICMYPLIITHPCSCSYLSIASTSTTPIMYTYIPPP
jgi:hypothetical protein